MESPLNSDFSITFFHVMVFENPPGVAFLERLGSKCSGREKYLFAQGNDDFSKIEFISFDNYQKFKERVEASDQNLIDISINTDSEIFSWHTERFSSCSYSRDDFIYIPAPPQRVGVGVWTKSYRYLTWVYHHGEVFQLYI